LSAGKYNTNTNKRELLNLVPNRLHPLVTGLYYTVNPPNPNGTSRFPHIIDSVPDTLPPEHYSNLEVIPHRDKLLEHVSEGSTVAEIGVATGGFAEKIYSTTHPDKLCLIDTWPDESEKETVEELFCSAIRDNEVEVIREDSVVALTDMDDNCLDFAYLDTTHLYKDTLDELEALDEKVSANGMIAGHDFTVGNIATRQMFGVIPAVFEFCVKRGWEMRYLTLESHGHFSFALTKLD